jgi:hypothetical protein
METEDSALVLPTISVFLAFAFHIGENKPAQPNPKLAAEPFPNSNFFPANLLASPGNSSAPVPRKPISYRMIRCRQMPIRKNEQLNSQRTASQRRKRR